MRDPIPPPGPARVLRLGDPRLRRRAAPAGDPRDPAVRRDAATLQATLQAFRREHGFGRAIAAPQIAIDRRLVALAVPGAPELLFDPEVVWRGSGELTLWDDCMCFPWLLVRLRRHAGLAVAYTDGDGQRRTWEKLDLPMAELLQHELDHLDGVLAVDRALDRDALVGREAFEADPAYFRRQVDYAPAP